MLSTNLMSLPPSDYVSYTPPKRTAFDTKPRDAIPRRVKWTPKIDDIRYLSVKLMLKIEL